VVCVCVCGVCVCGVCVCVGDVCVCVVAHIGLIYIYIYKCIYTQGYSK